MTFFKHDHKYEILIGDDVSTHQAQDLKYKHCTRCNWTKKLGWSTVALFAFIPILALATLQVASFFKPVSTTFITSNINCLEAPVRREWRTLDRAEKTEYLEAVLCLTTQPSALGTNGTLYDDFSWIHQRSIEQFHRSAPFLPWHRLMIHAYEKQLRERCCYSGILPYWDWSQDSHNFAESPIWDLDIGFGGDGANEGGSAVPNGTCVRDGPFASLEVRYFDIDIAPHCLSRGFAQGDRKRELGSLVAPGALENLMEERNYERFASELEHRAHSFVGNSIGGDFLAFTGPNDPVFFLHHGNIDRLWAKWQQKHATTLAYCGKASMSTDKAATLDDILDTQGLIDNVTVSDVMDTKSGMFCYRY